ncbi:MAG: hypothetical protein ABIK09_07525 [Pseudomonadota bacterium]
MGGARTVRAWRLVGRGVAVSAVVAILLGSWTDVRAGGGGTGIVAPEYASIALGFRFRSDGLGLERDHLFMLDPDPGKIRLELLLTGHGGRLDVMVWSLDRLDPPEWFRRAVGPVLQGDRTWQPVPWLQDADEAVVVEIPASPTWPAQRVYGIRTGGLGFTVLCTGVGTPALSESCDRVARTLEVNP